MEIGMEKIEIKNLYKVFGSEPRKGVKLLEQGKSKEEIYEQTGLTVAVQGASFVVNKGEIFVVMGLSGSGKSTLVRMLNRLIEPTSGEVLVDGQNILDMNKDELVKFRRSKTSMVFQSFALMPHQTVLENAAFGLELDGMDKKQREERALDALKQVGLEGLEKAYPNELSGGMQQRVGLARGLAVDPDILLMDEAFSALDPLIKTEMQDELLKLQDRHERTIIFISHDLDEALRIGDRIAIMQGGRVIQVGTPEEILQNPADDYVRAFFRGVDPTGVISAGDIARDSQPTVVWHTKAGSPRATLEMLSIKDREFAYVLDSEHRFLGVVSSDSLRDAIDQGNGASKLEHAFLTDAKSVQETDSLQDILSLVASHSWPIPVVNSESRYRGVVSKNLFLRTLNRAEKGTYFEQSAS
ncbi:MAG: glycine betaine/L-proline ABC transporter ATP-binding protein ProV [Shewanella vesiculosa]|nr:glycine betaine/L-proline ABC transporter ATP-binding protein ProV [Shewanella vesiculosa]NCQ43782.1 glycine betaine/L-proline ABC transporter ATP-binding protein ProV [Shewanella frigidimarina]PIP99546.1 MAG: proline/glycine betaine ABC transporter ATP-binding protein ProV [Shewanella sp. CG18_big_fil_WC_8_21_14_2_50_42_11]PIX72032.1 MAG: proline/glycine betaine ABC transporter ATP-binding protein ProV [Shewanella sp. CG_4_10_14_3_um_filter_42_91]PIY66667.1 MAG: proline/glycine betaine ABC 